jgi:hypothetical protein
MVGKMLVSQAVEALWSRVSDLMRTLNFFNLPETGTLTSEYQKVFLGSEARPARKTDNFTAICEPIV